MITVFGSFIGGVGDYIKMFEFVNENGIECLSEIF